MELAIGLLAGTTFWLTTARVMKRRDHAIDARIEKLSGSIRIRRARLSPTKLLVRLGSRLPGNRDKISQELTAAGMDGALPDAVLGGKLLLTFLGFFVGLQFGPLAALVAPGLAFAGYRLPNLVVGLRLKVRREEFARDLPDAVELLAVTTRAGLNVALALRRVADAIQGSLGDELRRTIRRMELGTPRQEALEDLAARNELDELETLVSILTGGERFGTRVASALEDFADEVRERRRQQAEELARKAPVKLLFPLIFLILPGFVLLTVVPLLLGTFSSLGF